MVSNDNFLADKIIPLLEQLTCTEVRISFAGGGDSGEIHNVEFRDKEGKDVYPWNGKGLWVWDEEQNRTVRIEPTPPSEPEPTVGMVRVVPTWQGEEGALKRVEEVTEFTLTGAVEEFVYTELHGTGIDWYNDDGGSGEWVLAKGKDGCWSRSLTVDVNEMISRTEYDTTTQITQPKMTPWMDLSNIDPDVLERAIKRAKEESQ